MVAARQAASSSAWACCFGAATGRGGFEFFGQVAAPVQGLDDGVSGATLHCGSSRGGQLVGLCQAFVHSQALFRGNGHHLAVFHHQFHARITHGADGFTLLQCIASFQKAANALRVDCKNLSVAIDGSDGFRVARFVEKPDAVRAQEFLDSGLYAWNGGIFAFRAGTFLAELAAHRPALAAAARRLDHVLFAGVTHPDAIELADLLLGTMPWIGGRVFYSDNGSTAVEVALKMAYQWWCHRDEPHRTLFVGFDDCYHGDTFGAMSVGRTTAFHKPYFPMLFKVHFAPTPFPYHPPSGLVASATMFAREVPT